MYRYVIYGIGIESEVKLYHLEQCEVAEREVYIHYGTVSSEIEQYIQQGINSTMSPVRVWFRNDIGIFVISNGNEILVQPVERATEDDIASFVLGWCIAFLFQQKGIPALHCSALEVDGKAILIAGNSGAGKSTIALSLQKLGYRYLVDDIAMIDIKNDFLIQPAFPLQKVCRNIAEEVEDSETLYYVNEKKDKFALRNMDNFCDEPRKLSTIFLLNKYDGAEVKMERLRGIVKWNAVMKNLFLRDAYMALGVPQEEVDRCLEIAGKVEVYAISRPEGRDTVAEICRKILEVV